MSKQHRPSSQESGCPCSKLLSNSVFPVPCRVYSFPCFLVYKEVGDLHPLLAGLVVGKAESHPPTRLHTLLLQRCGWFNSPSCIILEHVWLPSMLPCMWVVSMAAQGGCLCCSIRSTVNPKLKFNLAGTPIRDLECPVPKARKPFRPLPSIAATATAQLNQDSFTPTRMPFQIHCCWHRKEPVFRDANRDGIQYDIWADLHRVMKRLRNWAWISGPYYT